MQSVIPKRPRSLSSELTIVFASLAAALVLVFSYFAFHLVSRSVEETVRRDLQNTVDQAVLAIDKELKERVREVETAILSPTLRDAAIYMSQEHATIPLSDRHEDALRQRFRKKTCLSQRPEADRHLEAIQSAHDYISQFVLTDRLGIAIACTSTPKRILYINETWWQEAVNRGVSLSNLSRDPDTGTYYYAVALPIYDGPRGAVGVLRAIFNLRAIQETLSAMRIGEHGYLLAMGRTGRVFAHPREDYLWKKVQDVPDLGYLEGVVSARVSRGVLVYDPPPDRARPRAGQPGASQPAASSAGNRRGSGSDGGSPARPGSLADASENSWILAYGRLFRPASLGPLGWTVVGTVSRAEVISPILSIRNRVASIGGTLVLLSVILVWLFSRRLARPLNDLVFRADMIAAGDLSVSLQVPARNEVSRLASALSSMVDSLQASNRSLARAKNNLEQVVTDRTHELEEKGKLLEEQSKQVMEASRLKSQFLANMSHELRTPLNAILALSDILAQRISGDLNDEQVKQVTIINRSGQNLLRLINDILDLSKIESGRLEVHPVVFEVSGMIGSIRDTIEPLAAEKDLRFEVRPDPALPSHIKGDDAKLRQILVNLLGNAIKFTQEGHIALELSRRHKQLPGSDEPPPPLTDEGPFWLELKVQDTGIGIAPDVLKKIFDEFHQVDGSATRKYGGSGLGLAISKRLVELLGGEISVSSTPGEGSVFRVLMPVEGVAMTRDTRVTQFPETPANDPPRALRAPSSPGTEARTAPSQGSSGEGREWVTPLREHPIPISPRFLDIRDDTHNLLPHIPTLLVVDDDPESLYVYRQFLSRKGYQVIFAINGEQVADKARQFSPVAIILDLMLPQKSGWEVLEELKATDDLKQIPVIIASVLDHRERGVCAGAFRYLTKPMSEKHLSAVLDELEKARKKDVRRVLVIDDDPVEIGIARTLFSKAGLDVACARSGMDGVAKAVSEQPDFIVLDLMMPDMDGFEVLSHLKEDRRTSSIPVLVYTAKDVSEEERRRLLSSARGIFPKVPLKIEEMLDELQRALETVPIPGELDEDSDSNGCEEEVEVSNSSTQPVPVTHLRERSDAEGWIPGSTESGSSAREDTETEPVPSPKAGHGRSRILLVEDDPANQYSLGFLLRSNGYEVIPAEDGEEGLQKARSERPDIILMDMMMPVMSGFDATRLLKEDEELRSIPVIAITAAAMTGDRERTLAAGCDDYISKPIDREQLLERVRHWLTTSKKEEPACTR